MALLCSIAGGGGAQVAQEPATGQAATGQEQCAAPGGRGNQGAAGALAVLASIRVRYFRAGHRPYPPVHCVCGGCCTVGGGGGQLLSWAACGADSRLTVPGFLQKATRLCTRLAVDETNPSLPPTRPSRQPCLSTQSGQRPWCTSKCPPPSCSHPTSRVLTP